MNKWWMTILCMSMLMACGDGNAIYHTRLDGYQGKKLRVKMDEKLKPATLENGEEGFLLTTEVKYSEGRRNRLSTLTETWLHSDYTLARKINKTFQADKLTKELRITVKGKDVSVVDLDGKGKVTREETITWKEDHAIYSEPLHVMYFNDLPNKGDTKPYWIFYDPMRNGAPVRVKNREKLTVTHGDKTYECIRYSVRSMSNPGKYNDYYVTADGKQVVKIVVGNIEFVPPGTPR